MVCGMLNDSLAPAIMAAVSRIRAEYADRGTPRTATGASVSRTNASAREREVLELAVQGLVKKEIADRLGLSYHTVDNHLRSIYTKLQVHTRGGAVAKAVSERLLSPAQ